MTNISLSAPISTTSGNINKMGQTGKTRPLHDLFAVTDDADQRVLYTQLWIALRKGSPTRPSLPEELVSIISRMAGLKARDTRRTIICDEPFSMVCWDEELAAIQLVTLSTDQGWTATPANPNGLWSWFDVGAQPVSESGEDVGINDSPASDKDQRTASRSGVGWKTSHHNRLAYGKIAFVEGQIMSFGEDGDAPMLRPGEQIVVRACAQCAWLMKWGHRAELRFWRWFEPIQDLVHRRLQSEA